MTAILAKGGFVAMAIEGTPGTYTVPTFTVPWTACKYDTAYVPLKDESVRNSDAVVHGIYQGSGDSSVDLTLHAYPDLMGYFLRHIGPDTVTPATSGTLTAATLVGDVSISTSVALTLGQVVKIGTGPTAEYAYCTAASTGAGPFVTAITTVKGAPANVGLQRTHASADPIVTRTKHLFKQTTPNIRPPAYSVSIYDLVNYTGFPGCRMSELHLKIDPKATVSLQAKFTGFPEQLVSSFTYGSNPTQPLLGWGWNMTNAGASSDRGLTLDVTMKRAVEAIHGSNGVQAPREVFAAGLEIDGQYKAIYDTVTDYNLYLQNSQQPAIIDVQKAIAFGGEELVVTMSQSGWPKGSKELGGQHVEASFDLVAIDNATDVGVAQVALYNWQTTAY